MNSNAIAGGVPLAVRQVDPLSALKWLALGWRDFIRSPLAGLMHGAFVAVAGWVVLAVSLRYGWVAPGAFSGLVIIGPVLVTGLYEISRLQARGEHAGVGNAIAAWRRGTRPLVQLGFLLAVLGTLWVGASALLFTFFAPAPLRGPLEFVRYAFVEQGNLLFTLWAILGGLGVAIVFSITAVSPPLLLGREVGFRQALLTSARAVGENPIAMLLWALVILVATSLSIASAMLGFLISVPVLGHASWHAYRDLVDVEGVALRNP
ncbi:MAG TPA: DUF2189 domain-containing protein [Burkholderiaceae bacterium]|nr:DUF2189 domain-containing protein [Burkholderiaceae bacterium]